MKLWLSMLVVAVATSAMKAAGPLALGGRRLPVLARRVVGLLAPALLAGLIVVELGGPGWAGVDGPQIGGVATAGVAYLAKVPILPAVVIGAVVAAVLRLLLA